MKKSFLKNVFSLIFSLFFCSCACSFSAQGIEVQESDFEDSVVTDIKTLDENTLQITFSKPANIQQMRIIQKPKSKNDDILAFLDAKNATEIKVQDMRMQDNLLICTLQEPTILGQEYIVYAVIADSKKSTQTVALPIVGYNNRMAEVLINEIRTEYSSNKANPTKTKAEFIELYVKKAGNLAGIQVYSADDDKKDVAYTFPPIDVKQGEYITLHYRLLPGASNLCIDETGAKLNLCQVQDASDKARDLWVKNTDAVFGKTQDVIVLRNLATGKLLDGILYSTSETDAWKNKTLSNLAKEVFETGIWQPGYSPQDAANCNGTTATRTLSRQNFNTPSSKSNWIITRTSGNTPGGKNCKEAFVPKTK